MDSPPDLANATTYVPSLYVNRLWLPGQATQATQTGQTGTLAVDACQLDFGGLMTTPGPELGPQIGHLTLAQQHVSRV